MNPLISVAIWGIVGGLAAGLVIHFKVPPDIRAKVERWCLRFGAFAPFMFIALANVSTKAVAAQAVVALGLIMVIPLVAGIVLYVARRSASGV